MTQTKPTPADKTLVYIARERLLNAMNKIEHYVGEDSKRMSRCVGLSPP